MPTEENHRLLIEIVSRLTHVETRLEGISKSADNVSRRLEEIEESHQKTLGVIQFSAAIVGIITAFAVYSLNLWVDQKIRDFKANETNSQQNQIIKKN